MSRLQLQLLGKFSAAAGGDPLPPLRTSKAQALLIFLAVEAAAATAPPETAVSQRRDILLDMFWPHLDLHAAQDNLRTTLYQLRQGIPDQQDADGTPIRFLISSKLAVAIDPAYRFELDVTDFTRHIAAGELETAVALYRGEFLEDFYLPDSSDFETWAQVRRGAYRRQALDALHTLAAADMARGEYELALHHARRQLSMDDLRERAYRQMMEALARLGQRTAALAQFEACRDKLQQELGIAPSQETEQIYAQIERDEIRPARRGVVPVEVFLPVVEPGEKAPLFVGREAELTDLSLCLARSAAGEGGVQFVLGGAGRGKTALVTELARRALAADPDLLVLSGQCREATGTGEPYLPFRQVLAQLTGDVTGSGLLCGEQAPRLWAGMRETIPVLVNRGPGLVQTLVSGPELGRRVTTIDGEQQAWYPALDELLAASGEGPPREELFGQVAATLTAAAAKRPLLIVLEDLHWTDAASAALLFSLSFELAASRILILGTYRPVSVAEARAHPLAPVVVELKRRYGDIFLDLGRQDEASGRAFIDAYLDSAPNDLGEEFRSELFRRTGGHALFVVELLRAMREREELFCDEDGRWRARPDVQWEAIPARVEGVVEQRFGRLDRDLQAALLAACVEGETFTAEIVADIQGLEDRAFVRRLSQEASRRHRLVQAAGQVWQGDHRLSRYRFRHQLFQQYLYQSLQADERAYLHEAVGLRLEAQSAAEPSAAAVLAWHFDRAGNRAKAVPYLVQAGDAARLLYATEEATRHYERALTLLREQGDYEAAASLLMKLGLTAMNAFDFEAAQAAYQESFALRRQGDSLETSAMPPALQTLRLVAEVPPIKDLADEGVDDLGLFPGLVRLTADFDVVPDVAQSWEVGEGGRAYLFHLRDDVLWSDGRPLTAGDFVFAWRQALDPQRGSPYAQMLFDIEGAADCRYGRAAPGAEPAFRALDERTLAVRLALPSAYFLQALATAVATPRPRHVVARHGASWAEPGKIATCGPFLLHAADDERALLLRNPRYYGPVHGNVERIEMRFCPAAENNLRLYEENEVDVVTIWPLALAAFQQAVRRHAGEYRSGPALATYGLSFNVNRPPFDDARVRRAFALATDRRRLAEIGEAGRGFPATGGFVPPGMPGHVPGIALPYNPQAARRVLADAGYADGRSLPPLTVLLTPWDTPRLPANVLQPWEKELGVQIIWKEVPWVGYSARVAQEQPHISHGGWIADYPDPDNFLRVGLRCLCEWHDEAYEQLIQAARQSLDHHQRMDLFHEAELILAHEAPILPLVYRNYHLLVKPWVKNFQPAMFFRPSWQHVIIAPH